MLPFVNVRLVPFNVTYYTVATTRNCCNTSVSTISIDKICIRYSSPVKVVILPFVILQLLPVKFKYLQFYPEIEVILPSFIVVSFPSFHDHMN